MELSGYKTRDNLGWVAGFYRTRRESQERSGAKWSQNSGQPRLGGWFPQSNTRAVASKQSCGLVAVLATASKVSTELGGGMKLWAGHNLIMPQTERVGKASLHRDAEGGMQ